MTERPISSRCTSNTNCPGVHPLRTGDYAVIGFTVTDEFRDALLAELPDAGVGLGETLVIVPAHVMREAAEKILETSSHSC